jgi:HSP20 family molecular chaperone IbpA
MSTLVPRVFDLADWLDGERFNWVSPPMRIEDEMTDTEYRISAELPGLNPEKDVEVTVDHGILSIRAERSEERKGAARSEFRYGTMQRAVRLPANADIEHIKAGYDKGVLTVTVPLLERPPSARMIPVEPKK